MARTQLTTQTIPAGGLVNPAFTPANVDGHMLDGDAELEVVNGSGGSITVTIETGGSLSGIALADLAVPIPAGQRAKWRDLDQRASRPTGAADAGKIYVNFSAVTSVTSAAFRKG